MGSTSPTITRPARFSGVLRLSLIDELFSVGDAAFQKKCEGRMERFKAKGVTILLVSHDLKLVQATCHRTLFLHHGRVVALGPTDEVVAEYQKCSALASVP